MATPAKTPGQMVTLGDGTEGRAVTGDQVPARFWRAKAAYEGTGGTMRILSYWKHGKWNHYERPAFSIFDGGSVYQDHVDSDFAYDQGVSDLAHVLVCVPLSYLDPEVNEFGEVSP